MTDDGVQNGIETAALKTLVAKIQANPSTAKTHWSARVEWSTKGTASRAFIRHFPPILFDEPPTLAGADSAPNPVEMVLAALGACLTTTFVANAALSGVPLDSVEVSVHGDLDLRGFLGLSPDVNPGYDAVEVRLSVRSSAPRSQLEALALQAEKTCPVSAILQRNVTVRVSLSTST